ncbi:MAG: glycoside hydrolase family 3 N-terminal domain-containing protein [Candidatus Zixiibacteriota bacterium]
MIGDIGKRFVFGLPGKKVTPFIRHMITKRNLFGIILFNRNFDTIDDLQKLCNEIKSLRDNIIIMIDQEGGDKSRIQKGFPNHPSNRQMGHKYSRQTIKSAYYQSAKALKDIGIDMNLAPVVDIGSENSYIHERTFADNYIKVSEYALAAIEGIQSAGVYSCAKHFVGLGTSFIDPHESLPIFEGELKYHLIPFVKSAIGKVDAIMTTHIIVPEISDKPITVSQKAIEIIRSDTVEDGIINIGYNGPVFTDDLLMGGATQYSDTPQVALEALSIGHDVALICYNEEKQLKALENFSCEIIKNSLLKKMHEESLIRLDKYFCF